MILGSQFYSLRTKTQTAEGLEEAFAKTKEMGYHAVQLSTIGKDIPADFIKGLIDKYGLPVACTHTDPMRVILDTDAVIADHKLWGCDEIGIGCFPVRPMTEGRETSFIEALREPIRKIKAAGLTLAYHNHAFEFEDGKDFLSRLAEELPDLNFILDVYWLTKAGKDPVAYMKGLAGRVKNLHFKDMSKDEDGKICVCGEGRIDFLPIALAAEEIGVKYGLVEQDNAPDLGDPYEQMAKSCRHMTPIVYR
ncbi:MAG: sugar phosphate isomerase/epimerase [Clostridia bacterium]|nr:sugar phosphate isomerase/epimerase [Clostridia bacterium]MBO7170232.1 sugar phosphate isomerase/epimerase [Clostridia bacterium]